jgi:hypothetical protein
VTLYGTNFGPAPGSVAACAQGATPCNGTPDMSVTVAAGHTSACPYCYWSDTQVNVLITPSPTSSGIYDLQLTSGGESPGLGFQAKPAGQGAKSNTAKVSSACPTSVGLGGIITDLPLADLHVADNFPHVLTGIGILSTMFVLPGPYTWNGAKITEAVSTVSNTCPIPPFPTDPCFGDSTFTVGPPGEPPSGSPYFGTIVPPLGDGEFFDTHAHFDPRDLLAVAGRSSCRTVCAQIYKCGGKTIGNFTITRNYSPSVIGAASVTRIQVQKQ